MKRRGFLGACLLAFAAPAIVRAESLMKIVVPATEIWVPSNELLTISMITSQALMILEKELQFGFLNTNPIVRQPSRYSPNGLDSHITVRYNV